MFIIPSEVKEKIGSSNCQKNIRITFPNNDHVEINNENLIEESFSFTESLCSGSSFSLGIVESPTVSFETVGIGNLKDKLVNIEIEIILDGYAHGSDIYIKDGKTVYVYRIPIGVFTIIDSKKTDVIGRRSHSGINSILNNDISLNTDMLQYLTSTWIDKEIPSRLYISDIQDLYFKKNFESGSTKYMPEPFSYTKMVSMYDLNSVFIPDETPYIDKSVTFNVSGECINIGSAAYIHGNLSPYIVGSKDFKDTLDKTIVGRHIARVSTTSSNWNKYISANKKVRDDIEKAVEDWRVDGYLGTEYVRHLGFEWEDGIWDETGEEQESTYGRRSNFIKRSEITKWNFTKMDYIDKRWEHYDYNSLTIRLYYWDAFYNLLYFDEILSLDSDTYHQLGFLIEKECEYVSVMYNLIPKSSTKLKKKDVENCIDHCMGGDISDTLDCIRPTKFYYGTKMPIHHNITIKPMSSNNSSDTLRGNYKDKELEYIVKDLPRNDINNEPPPYINSLGDTYGLYFNNDIPELGYGMEEVVLAKDYFTEEEFNIMDYILVSFEEYNKGTDYVPTVYNPISAKYYKTWGRNVIKIPSKLNIEIIYNDYSKGQSFVSVIDCNDMNDIVQWSNISINSGYKRQLTDTKQAIIPKIKKSSNESALDYRIDIGRSVVAKDKAYKVNADIKINSYDYTFTEEYKKSKTGDSWNKETLKHYSVPASALGGIDVRSIMASYSELQGCIGRINRYGEFELLDLSVEGYLTPSATLTPSTGLVPTGKPIYSTDKFTQYGGTILASKWSSLIYNDSPAKPIGRITCTYNNTNLDGDQSTYSYTLDGSYPNGYKTYDISNNAIIKSSIYTPNQIKEIIYNMINKGIGNIIYTPCDIEFLGRPELEAGDIIQVIDTNGFSFQTIIFKRTLKGIQHLIDNVSIDLSDDDNVSYGSGYSGGSVTGSTSGGEGGIYNSGVTTVNGMSGDVTINLPQYTYNPLTKTIIFKNIQKY